LAYIYVCRNLYRLPVQLQHTFAHAQIIFLMHFLVADKSISPKTANDVKLISGGKILENDKSVAQCRAPFGDLPSNAITMHVVVQPSSAKSKPDKKANKLPKTTRCSCTIL